jgi:hypothetical protein
VGGLKPLKPTISRLRRTWEQVIVVFAVALKALAIWAGILVLAVANGALRESVLVPRLGSRAGLAASGVSLSALVLLVAYASLPWLRTREPMHLLFIGLGWLVLTLLFEFSFGLWQGKAWPVLLEAYTFRGGNLWPAVLAVTAIAPYLAAKLRGWA